MQFSAVTSTRSVEALVWLRVCECMLEKGPPRVVCNAGRTVFCNGERVWTSSAAANSCNTPKRLVDVLLLVVPLMPARVFISSHHGRRDTAVNWLSYGA